jgi:hypothetical protein
LQRFLLWVSGKVQFLISLWLYCTFSTNYISLISLAQNKEAAKLLTLSESWPRPAPEALKTMRKTTFWRDVHLAIELMKPITEAITLVEGNNHMLSSMLPLWKRMRQSLEEFLEGCEAHQHVNKEAILAVFDKR